MVGLQAPGESEIAANSAFESLLWSMSRPGRVRELPEPGENPVIQALIDRECKVYTDDTDLMPILKATGATLSSVEDADHVFLGDLKSIEPVRCINVGSDPYPDEGATVVIRVRLEVGPVCRFSGPGVDNYTDLSVDGLPEGFWQLRNGQIRYPMGFDLILIDHHKVVSVPRSTIVEKG